jgi:DNA-binding SARP family transcriptional activator
MQFRLLGPLEVSEQDRPLDLGATKQRSLLALLLLNANQVVSTDRLIAELWGESPPATVAKSVQV